MSEQLNMCVGCEGKPSADNNPCAVCGRAAPVGEVELPALPHKIGPVYNGNYWTQSDTVNPPGERLADVFTAEQVRQAQRDAIAPYAERIRVLERERAALIACIDGRTAAAPTPIKSGREEA